MARAKMVSKRFNLELGSPDDQPVLCVNEPDNKNGYVWIGTEDRCFGVVKDKDVHKLADALSRLARARKEFP